MSQNKETCNDNDELAWFNLESYSELKNEKNKNSPNYIQWYSLVNDRVNLEAIIKASKDDVRLKELASTLFEKLKTHPLRPLGFEHHYRGRQHETNTSTVKSVTESRLNYLYSAMTNSKESKSFLVDEIMMENADNVFDGLAHVMIDLRATDEQICSDFKLWLSKWRTKVPKTKVVKGKYNKKIKSWANALIVPYMDLELFSLLTNMKIKKAKKLELLLPKSKIDERESQRIRLSQMRTKVFNPMTVHVLEHLKNKN
ncbi:DUF6387 family protein [Undibacterium sp. Dicai25W]|uniref:DUF6387 family protein n=1 Tax=Undibacterium sp. Dicai25W TaxID=3413034 RepID=UPI003BF44698